MVSSTSRPNCSRIPIRILNGSCSNGSFLLVNRHKRCPNFAVSASLLLLERVSRNDDLESDATLGNVKGQHRALYGPNEAVCHTIAQDRFGKTGIRSLSLLRRGPLGKDTTFDCSSNPDGEGRGTRAECERKSKAYQLNLNHELEYTILGSTSK